MFKSIILILILDVLFTLECDCKLVLSHAVLDESVVLDKSVVLFESVLLDESVVLDFR